MDNQHLDIPTYLGYVTGYRAWRIWVEDKYDTTSGLRSSRLALGSLVMDYQWPPMQPMSLIEKCREEPRCPNFHCRHGVYLFKQLDLITQFLPRFSRTGIFTYRGSSQQQHNPFINETTTEMVVGTVAGWGMTVDYTLGYRTEYAYPLSFILPEEVDIEYESLVYLLARIYRVRVETVPLEKLKNLKLKS